MRWKVTELQGRGKLQNCKCQYFSITKVMEFKTLCSRVKIQSPFMSEKEGHHYPQERGTWKLPRWKGRSLLLPASQTMSPPGLQIYICKTGIETWKSSSVSAVLHAIVFTKKTRNVIITGGCVLWLIEKCIYPINLGEFWCLMGARVRGVAETLLRFVQFSDNYLLLLIHGVRIDVAWRDLDMIPESFKSDYEFLCVSVK